MPSMHSSSHMHHLTLNILKIAEVFLKNKFTGKKYEENIEKQNQKFIKLKMPLKSLN